MDTIIRPMVIADVTVAHVAQLGEALQKDADARKILNKLCKDGCDRNRLCVGIISSVLPMPHVRENFLQHRSRLRSHASRAELLAQHT
jgi:hypothetical protein